jgi:hypothetical protein
MDRVTPRSVLHLPVQVRDDGSVSVLTDSEQQDLHHDTGWQGKSIPNSSISGSELATLSRSTWPRRTSATKEGGEGDEPIERLRLRGFHIAADALAQQREQRASSDAPAERSHQTAMDALHYSPLVTIDGVIHDDDDNRHPEEEIEGRDGRLWDYAVTDDDSELDDKEEETAPDDASATGHTYDDMADSAPPHLRCVVLPLSSHHPSSGAPPRHYRFCCRRRPGVDAGSGRSLGEAVTWLFGA